MRRLLAPVATLLSLGIGGGVGVLYERKKAAYLECLPILHANGKTKSAQKHSDVVKAPAGNRDIKEVNNERRQSEIMRFGFPGLENIKSKEDYVLSYNRRLRLANWVCEHLTAERMKRRDADRSKCDFKKDFMIHNLFQTSNADYRKSGYDRGHLAAAANHTTSQESACETFLLSNMSPQVGSGFNRDSWEHLEKHCRQVTKIYKNVYIITGPLFLPRMDHADQQLYVKYKVIGQNRVAVPTHFFKVILGETKANGLEMQSYILPNQPISEKTALHKFQVPVETIEKSSGLLFFNKVPRNSIKQIRPVIKS